MTKDEPGSQLNLTVVALVALVAIVGLVALVLNTAGLARLSTGGALAAADGGLADEANLAGQSFNRIVPTHQYDSYNPDERVADFVVYETGAVQSVSVDVNGRGVLVWRGNSYAVSVVYPQQEDSPVKIDMNRNAKFDIKETVQIDGYFLLR